MSRQKSYLILALVGLFFVCGTADNSVHILSKYGQLVTSSTLNWLQQSHYELSKEIVIGGFEIEKETEGDSYTNQAEKPQEKKKTPLFVCRVYHTGVWVSGSQKAGEKRCTVSIHGNVHSYERYELLENVDNAARVSWEYWDKYIQTPVGAVATDDMYVARRGVRNNEDEDPNSNIRYTHYIGTFISNDNLGEITYVKRNGRQGSAKSGDVLVETEPIYYEFNSVKLNWHKKRIIKSTQRILGEATIKNTGAMPANMAEAFGYSYNYLVYWGQGHAILKGLNTSITLSNGTALPDIVWGLEQKSNRTDVYTVQINLEPGTGVKVTLRANYTDMEVPYSGKLVSHYEDGVTKARVIAGIRREETMFDVTPEFGPIFFLNNNSLVPTTTQAPTTEPTMTTMSHDITKETHHLDMGSSEHGDGEHDENMIIPPKKHGDTSNMQSDDGGPLSLKNKVETGHSGTSSIKSIKSSLLIIPLLITAVLRIT